MHKTIVAFLSAAALVLCASQVGAQTSVSPGQAGAAPTSQQAIPDVMPRKNGRPQTGIDGQNGTGNASTESPTSGPDTQMK
jgi:hypothetical protein